MCCMEYVFWIVLSKVLAEARFQELEGNPSETKNFEISYKVDTEHTGSVHITNRIGVAGRTLF